MESSDIYDTANDSTANQASCLTLILGKQQVPTLPTAQRIQAQQMLPNPGTWYIRVSARLAGNLTSHAVSTGTRAALKSAPPPILAGLMPYGSDM